jgi:hypothetical protein
MNRMKSAVGTPVSNNGTQIGTTHGGFPRSASPHHVHDHSALPACQPDDDQGNLDPDQCQSIMGRADGGTYTVDS